MNNILFEVLRAVVIIAVILATRYLVPWIRQKIEIANNEVLDALVETAVRFAEQTVKGEGQGMAKKDVVTGYLRQLLDEKHISITDTQLDALIEAAVYAMNEAKAA